MSEDDCTLLCREGLADLHPLYAADKGNLADLCEAVAALETFANGHAADIGKFCETYNTEYVRLFVTNRDGVPAPPYASCYEPVLMQGDAPSADSAALATNDRQRSHAAKGSHTPHGPMMGPPAQRMQILLAEVGLVATSAANEPPDHISTQLEYLYFLLSTGWRDGDSEARQRATEFTRKEMQPWIAKFYETLRSNDQFGLFSGCAAILVAILNTIAE